MSYLFGSVGFGVSTYYSLFSSVGGAGCTVTSCALAVMLAESGSTLLISHDLSATTAVFGMLADDHDVSATLTLAGSMDRRRMARHDYVVIDEGSSSRWSRHESMGSRLFVTRLCYLSLRAHMADVDRESPDGVIVVHEGGRALRADDVGEIVGAPVIAEIPMDPVIARCVDAGLLAARLPSPMSGAFAQCLDRVRT